MLLYLRDHFPGASIFSSEMGGLLGCWLCLSHLICRNSQGTWYAWHFMHYLLGTWRNLISLPGLLIVRRCGIFVSFSLAHYLLACDVSLLCIFVLTCLSLAPLYLFKWKGAILVGERNTLFQQICLLQTGRRDHSTKQDSCTFIPLPFPYHSPYKKRD